MKRFFKFMIFLCMLPSTFMLRSQQDTIRVHALSRSFNDSICIRWVPGNYLSWYMGNQFGYIIQRKKILDKGTLCNDASWITLNMNPFKPSPLSNWEKPSENDKMCALAAQAIFGKDFVLTSGKKETGTGIRSRLDEQEARFSFALYAADHSVLAAQLSGLWFTDRNIEKNSKYLYRIFFPFSAMQTVQDTGYVFTGPDELIPLPAPVNVRAESGEQVVLLHWNAKFLEPFYNSYLIERSDDSCRTFSPLSNLPLLSARSEFFPSDADHIYLDSVPQYNKKYFYRLSGINSFGELGPYSDTVSAISQPEIKSFPIITLAQVTGSGLVNINWELSGETISSFPHSYQILRSQKPDGKYEPISKMLDKKVSTYTDSLPSGTNYYKVIAWFSNGQKKISFPALVQTIDTIPPAPPDSIMARVDSNGIVHLSWNPPKDADLYGFRIYRSDKSFEEISLLTPVPITDTSFNDTTDLSNLNKEIWYRLMSLDLRQNHSVFSKPFRVNKPDKIPPAVPMLLKAESITYGILIRWNPSASEDVDTHFLLRKSSDKEEPIKISLPNCDSIPCHYLDTTFIPGMDCLYSILAQDLSGNTSMSPQIIKIQSTSRNPINEKLWRAFPDRENRNIRIEWLNGLNKGERIVIYKSVNDSEFEILGFLAGDVLQWIDKNVMPDTQYSYKIRKTDVLSGNSMFSAPILINY